MKIDQGGHRMEREYSVQAFISVSQEMSEDEFWDIFIIDFVEQNNWYFGGGLHERKARKEFEIDGCISVEDHITYEVFYNKLMAFIKSQNWHLSMKVDETIYGYYINEDGTKGKHVFEGSGYMVERGGSKLKKIIFGIKALSIILGAVWLLLLNKE